MYDTIDQYFENFINLPQSDKKKYWEDVFIGMATHTRKRVPTELLLKRRPNEDENIHKYRVANYRAITYGSMNKALDDLYRIVSGISYTLNVEQNVRDYLNTHVIGQYNSSIQNEIINPKLFIEKITLKRDIEDPNGFLVWFPAGEGLTDSSQKVLPTPKLVLSSQYIYSDDHVFIYECDSKSPLRDEDGGVKLEGVIYYFITKSEIWKMYQTGTLKDPKWEQVMIYKHDLGAFPVIVLGGDMNTDGYYESFFSPYLAFGDEAVHQFSDWQAIMTTSSFPIKEMFGTECKIRRVNKHSNNPNEQEEGYVGGGNGEFELEITQPDPYGIIKRKVPLQNLNDDTLPVDIPSIRYINPDISIAKYSGESWEKLIEKAEQALNIDMSVGLDQSGVAKQIDKESQYSMITKIGNNFFNNIYEVSLKIIDGYLNRKPYSKSSASINKPSTFWVKSENELVIEIGQLKTSNAPLFFLSEASLDLAKKRFNGNPVNQKIFKYISLYDAFYTFTSSEKNQMISSGVLSKEDYVRSLRMFPILNQIAEELSHEKFMLLSYADINLKFEEKVKDFFPQEETILTDDNGNPI